MSYRDSMLWCDKCEHQRTHDESTKHNVKGEIKYLCYSCQCDFDAYKNIGLNDLVETFFDKEDEVNVKE